MNRKILFITATRIGDAVLSNGILSHLIAQNPEAKVTVVCGSLVQSLYEGVPEVEHIIALKKLSWKRHWFKLWAEVVQTKWDIVVDLRNSAVSRMICARSRYIFGTHIDQTQHKTIQNAQVIGLDYAPSTRVWVNDAQKLRSLELVKEGPAILGVGPAANWIGKSWPIEKFIELVSRLIAKDGPFHGWRVAVFAAPGEESPARILLESLPQGVGIDLIAKGNPAEAQACLGRCGFYIGNDSGLMHSAAAAGVPTLGLFGPSYSEIYAPFGPKASFIRTPESAKELIGYDGFDSSKVTKSLMDHLSVERVYDAVVELKNRS